MRDTAPASGDAPRAGRVPHQRQQEIYLLAMRNGSVEVTELAHHFEVTTETIRRDLSELQSKHLLRRVHGGAVATQRHSHEPMIDLRDTQNATEKHDIALLALGQIPDSGSVLIDSGSTSNRFAEVFPVDSGVQVMTNSLSTGLTLARRGVNNLMILGGAVRINTLAMVDASVVETVRRVRADVLFISCDGLSLERGLTTPYREESLVKRAMIESARWVVALVDASKFGSDHTFGYAGFEDIDVLVTDRRASVEDRRAIEAAGVEVLCA